MYNMIYNKHFHSKNIPYTWMPKWSGELTNPSGRLINS